MTSKFILKELARYETNTYADIIYRNALLYSDEEAFKYGLERVTFFEFNARVNSLIHALQKIGVKKGEQAVAFVLTNDMTLKTKSRIEKAVVKKLLRTFHLTSDETVLNGTRTALKKFGITEKEISTVPESHYGDLILEKIALVDVIK